MKEIKNLTEDLKTALKNRDSFQVSVLRLLQAEMKNLKIEKRRELSDEEKLQLVRKSVKKHEEAADLYQKNNRADLADKEQKETSILRDYLPQELSAEQLQKKVAEILAQQTPELDFGQAMKLVMSTMRGQADGRQIKQVVENILKK